MGKLLTILCCSLIFVQCTSEKEEPETDTGKLSLDLLSVDRSFCSASKERGMKAAYIDYLDSNAVLLRPDNLPIAGADAIDFLIQQEDNDIIFSWDPQHAEVANSGDLGFTYGVFKIQLKEMDSSIFGTYSRIWKKQKTGGWKLMLDTENMGIGN